MEKGKLSLIKDFGKLFNAITVNTEDFNKPIPEDELKIYLDPASVCGVIPLNKGFKEILLSAFDISESSKIPTLDYTKPCNNGSVYSCEYLKIVIELCKHYDSIKLKTGDCYPLTVETKDFKIILAPRVEND